MDSLVETLFPLRRELDKTYSTDRRLYLFIYHLAQFIPTELPGLVQHQLKMCMCCTT